MLFWGSVGALVLIVAIPLLPGVLEMVRPRDDDELHIDQTFVRDPRFFGISFRSKIRPLLDAHPSGSARVHFLNRGKEYVRIADQFALASGERTREALLCRGTLQAGDRVQLTDVYARREVRAGDGVHARAVACDGAIYFGKRTRIDRWVDALADVTLGEESSVGMSASTTGRLRLAHRTRFERAFGHPVVTSADVSNRVSPPKWSRIAVVESTTEDQPDVIAGGNIHVKAGSHILGSIKCYGNLYLGKGVRVDGNVIGRTNIYLDDGTQIAGHVFSECNVRTGQDVRVGSTDTQKTMYAARRIVLGGSNCIYGWVVAECGGAVR